MQFTQSPGNRPDLNVGRGGPEPNDRQERSMKPPSSVQMPYRPEMQGPKTADIDNILSGLKTKTVNVHENNPMPPPMSAPMPSSMPPPMQTNIKNISMQKIEDDSLISISSLKDLQNTTMPKKASRRSRNTSDKNTISLDI